DTGRRDIDIKRWQRKAIDESISQIYGAERWISLNDRIVQSDGAHGLNFPEVSRRRVHRIGVALGSKGKVSFEFGAYGKGFVHVPAQRGLQVLNAELNTISDFLTYLKAKEECFQRGTAALFYGEEDLLALYLSNDREFPPEPDFIALDGELWDSFSKSLAF